MRFTSTWRLHQICSCSFLYFSVVFHALGRRVWSKNETRSLNGFYLGIKSSLVLVQVVSMLVSNYLPNNNLHKHVNMTEDMKRKLEKF